MCLGYSNLLCSISHIFTHAPTQPEVAVTVVVGVATTGGSGSNAHMSWHMHMGATVTNMESHVQKIEQVHDSQRHACIRYLLHLKHGVFVVLMEIQPSPPTLVDSLPNMFVCVCYFIHMRVHTHMYVCIYMYIHINRNI